MGISNGSLIHVIWRRLAPMQSGNWLLQNGFSIGIADTIADVATMEEINEIISKAKTDVKDLIKLAQEKRLEAKPGRRTMVESFENRVNQVLNKARDDAGSSTQKSLSESINLKAMVTAGSKGSFISISQMTACVQRKVFMKVKLSFYVFLYFYLQQNEIAKRNFIHSYKLAEQC